MYLKEQPLDVAGMLEESRHSDGGICVFLGVVRNENGGRPTEKIEYQAYEAMAESEIDRIAKGLALEWPDAQVAIRHRVGELSVGEIAVAIVASAPHRAEAFAACRAAIDRIKTTVPIWKREFHPDGTTEWIDPTAAHAPASPGAVPPAR